MLWSQLPYWSRKTAKNPTYNAFYTSKLQHYVEEGLLFQNISKSKNYPCWPWSPISSHNTKLGHATFCWFCDAGSHITLTVVGWVRSIGGRCQAIWTRNASGLTGDWLVCSRDTPGAGIKSCSREESRRTQVCSENNRATC